MELIQLPLYDGFESSYEDIVYSFFRKLLNDRGYSFKVKRTGFGEIDGLLPSYASGKKDVDLVMDISFLQPIIHRCSASSSLNLQGS